MQKDKLRGLLSEFPTVIASSVYDAGDFTVEEIETLSSLGYSANINDKFISFEKKQSANRVEMALRYMQINFEAYQKLNSKLFDMAAGSIRMEDLIAAAIERLQPVARSYKRIEDEVISMLS